MSDPLVADLLEGDASVECHGFEEGENGLLLLDEEGEVAAYVPYQRLDFVHPKGAGRQRQSRRPQGGQSQQSGSQRSGGQQGGGQQSGDQQSDGQQGERPQRSFPGRDDDEQNGDGGAMPKNAIDEHAPSDGE